LFTRISLTRLYVGSIYKLIFIGLVFSLLPLCLVFGVLAVFGFNTVNWNGQQMHGLMGLFLGPVMGMMFAGVATLIVGTACVFGLWIFSKFRPLSLWAKNVVHHSSEAA
jgi:hypothetical protein